MILALCGLCRAGADAATFEKTLELFENQGGDWDYSWLPLGEPHIALLELARAARSLGRHDQARDLLRRAREGASTEADREIWESNS